MELKDAVLSTLAEIEDNYLEEIKKENAKDNAASSVAQSMEAYADIAETEESLERFLVNLRERILVLFEGLLTIQHEGSGEILQVEKKLDLIVNFLEYMLATIDEKLDKSQE
ncbi:MAG: hypothetical protein JHC37_06805 [Campylobacteraceae bacterium]|jgi:hypothetical protein|nr:hypothetical protein [Campylobacteraceae bacterium]